MIYVFVLAIGLAAGALSGVIGTGSTIILLPILVYQYGPKQAVPIMAISALMSNIGKVAAWWRDVNWQAFLAYSITGAPAAAIGARTLLILPSRVVDVALGLFFLAMVPGRRWLTRRSFTITLWQLAVAGAGAFVGKAVVQRMNAKTFNSVLDGLLLCSGVALLIDAVR